MVFSNYKNSELFWTAINFFLSKKKKKTKRTCSTTCPILLLPTSNSWPTAHLHVGPLQPKSTHRRIHFPRPYLPRPKWKPPPPRPAPPPPLARRRRRSPAGGGGGRWWGPVARCRAETGEGRRAVVRPARRSSTAAAARPPPPCSWTRRWPGRRGTRRRATTRRWGSSCSPSLASGRSSSAPSSPRYGSPPLLLPPSRSDECWRCPSPCARSSLESSSHWTMAVFLPPFFGGDCCFCR